MFRFHCEWREPPLGPTRSGYDLGHMTFTGDQGECTSRGRKPDQAMMLVLSISQLLHGLQRLNDGESSTYKFIAVDSSFCVDFDRTSANRIAVRCGKETVDELPASSLLQSIVSGVHELLRQPENQLPQDDLGRRDLIVALTGLSRSLQDHPRNRG